MKKSLYSALLATAFMPMAALAQDATTTPAPAEPPAAEAPATPTDDASEGTTTTTTVPMDGADDADEPATGTEPAAEPTEPADPAADAPDDSADAPMDTTTTTTPPAGEAPPMDSAAEPMDTEEPSTDTVDDAATPPEDSAAAAQIDGPFVTVPLSGAWRVTDLEGKEVYDANDESIGEITDVLVAEEGEVIAVLVGVGGFLGIGQKDVAVSMQSLEFGPGAMEGLPREEDVAAAAPAAGGMAPAAGGAAPAPAAEPVTPVVGEDNLPDRIVLNVTREELEAAPAYEDVEAGTATETEGMVETPPAAAQ